MDTMLETKHFPKKKLQKQLKEEIAFPYSISTLGFVLKKLGSRFKRQQRESIKLFRPTW